ncbi:hypothetical protein B0H21DRAFT_164949 [Amylocystis lapponica]|nr:hypothetical protein B0H21DRAFT_164949 [Amylocystis lapponica]
MTTGSKLSGPYFLMNLQSETILDCDWKCKEIIGAKLHGRPSQQWQFAPSGEGYTIHNLLTTKQYLTVREKVHDKGKVMASSFPVEWAVSRTQNDEEDCIRIGWAGTDSVVNLADGGSATEGTKVGRSA